MRMRSSWHRCLLPLLVVFAAAPGPGQEPEPQGSEPAERREGELQQFINRDTSDVLTKLEVLRHEIYGIRQQLTVVRFGQLYGDRVRLEKVLYPTVDADIVPGYVFTPAEATGSGPRPGLVVVHGGYHGSLKEELFFDLVVRAVEEGYIVIFPEYRGSKGYGAEHYNALNYGGKEVDDVLRAAEFLAARDDVDGSRMGIFGRSKGGYLALLAIEREPERFRAAVDVVGLVDFVAYMSYKPEYRRRDVARQPNFQGLPDENLPAYIEASPITHIDRIQTPLLILSTTHDRTVPLELHTQRLVNALKAREKTYEYHLYERAPGGHAFAYADTEEARDAMERTFRFLNKYLRP